MEDTVPTEEFDEILEAENELAELDSRINRFNENRVADKTRGVYSNSQARFILWTWKKRPDLLTPEFELQSAPHIEENDSKKQKFIKEFLKQAPNNPPLVFARLTPQDFLRWIASLK